MLNACNLYCIITQMENKQCKITEDEQSELLGVKCRISKFTTML